MGLKLGAIGEMDLESCKKNKLVKEVKIDHPLIDSLLKTSEKKLKTQDMIVLNSTTSSSKISLAYDSLREILEALALSKGLKIYNHECYISFLKEVLKESGYGDEFDNFRKIRNSINYYGKDIPADEAEIIIQQMKLFIGKIKFLFKNWEK